MHMNDSVTLKVLLNMCPEWRRVCARMCVRERGWGSEEEMGGHKPGPKSIPPAAFDSATLELILDIIPDIQP